MSTFWSADASYVAASRASVYVVHKEPGAVEAVASVHGALRKLRAADDTGVLDELEEQVRFARFRLISTVLPYDNEHLGLAVLSDLIRRVGENASRSAFALATAASDAIDELCKSSVNPLGEAAVEALAELTASDRLLVLRYDRLTAATTLHLAERGVPARVITASALASLSVCESLVLVGPPSFFPEATWTAARADSIVFVHYPFGWRAPESGGLLGPEGGLITPTFRESGILSTRHTSIETLDVDDSIRQAAERAAKRSIVGGRDEVDAFMLVLSNGYAVWTEADDRNWMLCIDVDDLSRPAIIRKPSRTIGASDYLLLREGDSAPDFVRDLADQRFGSRKHRVAQETWKDGLRTFVAVNGHSGAESELRRRGGQTSNTRYWVGPRCIHPQRRRDFEAVCAVSGLADRSGELWEAMQKIRRAHLRAGQSIRRELESSLLQNGASELVDRGYSKFEVAGLGELAAYAVLYRHPTVERIAGTRIDRPFLAEEAGWPG